MNHIEWIKRMEREELAHSQRFPVAFDPRAPGEPFVVAMPVPNITGSLHLGHAVNLVLQDVIARFRRSRGDNVFFPPGTDHAGLGGQFAAERRLTSEGKSRSDMGRAEFVTYMQGWHAEHESRLVEQMRALGLSCNWERAYSTNSEESTRIVQDMFVRACRSGLVYPDTCVVNWCCRCQSCVSEMEVGRRECTETLHHLRIRVGDAEEELVTLHPELLLGAAALGVAPNHPRFSLLVGKEVWMPAIDRDVPIVEVPARDADAARPDGVRFDGHLSLVLPAYNATDWDLAERVGLPCPEIFGRDGRVSESVPRYGGMAVEDCRRDILEGLLARGSVIKTEPYLQGEAVHTLCGGRIRPRVERQWYLKRSALAPAAARFMAGARPTFSDDAWRERCEKWVTEMFSAERYERQKWWEGACLAIVQSFTSNPDWVISRQNWWGPRIPAYFCTACGHATVAHAPPEACERCADRNLVPDEGVVDIWFGSAFWSACVTPWPERGVEADLVVVGHDVLYFWIPLAEMLASELLGRRAIRRVLVHGLICDEDGRKMSKSLGNSIDLREALERHGVEAVRAFALRSVRDRASEEWIPLSVSELAESEAAVLRMYELLRRDNVNRDGRPLGVEEVRRKVLVAHEAERPGEAYAHVEDLISLATARGGHLQAADADVLLDLLEPFHPLLSARLRRERSTHGEESRANGLLALQSS